MKFSESKPAIFTVKGGELPLSGKVLVELLQSILSRGMPFRFRAKGISMYPFIKDDDVITISPLCHKPPRFGDVVAFIRPNTGNLIVHRVIRRSDSNSFFIKGDNLDNADGYINISNILGYVTKVERKGKIVFLGFGLERFLIALLARRGSVYQLLFPVWRLIRPIVRYFRYE